MITRRLTIPDRVTVTQAADILNVSRAYVYKLIEAKELQTEKYGPKTTLVLRDSLIRWLRTRGAHVAVHRNEIVISRARIPLDMERIREFCRRWHISEFALFGSVLRDDFMPDSDVDVLVTFTQDAPVSLFSLPRMQHELEQLFGREVDLVSRCGIEQSRNTLRRDNILNSAEVVYREAA